ncbi:MAG: hypothetical protein IKN77_01740 [Paludibacteraceae bacterium]|nr:hypothetical protein [Paludibacteraceae bacterium]
MKKKYIFISIVALLVTFILLTLFVHPSPGKGTVSDSSPEIISPEGCSPQKDKSPNNEQVEDVPEENTEDVDYTFTLHKTDYKKIVMYSEGLDSEMMTNIILRDSIVEKILEVKPPIIKIELFDGGYGIVECDDIASAKLITGAIYSHFIDDEGVVGFKPVMVYRWVGGKPLK